MSSAQGLQPNSNDSVPGGSAKDRVALNMMNKSLPKREGETKKRRDHNRADKRHIPVSALLLSAAARGYKAIIIMPDTMSVERIKLTKAYGAEVLLTEGKLGMAGAVAKAGELAASTPGSMIAGQFVNPANPEGALSHDRS